MGEIADKSAKDRMTMELSESTKQSWGHTEWVQKISLKLHVHTMPGQLKILAGTKTILDWAAVHT